MQMRLVVLVFGAMTLLACPNRLEQPTAKPDGMSMPTPHDGRVTFETVEMSLTINHARVQDTDFVTVEVLTPKGKPYTKQQLALDDQGQAVLTIPIRGTFIEDRALAGQWTALATYNYS